MSTPPHHPNPAPAVQPEATPHPSQNVATPHPSQNVATERSRRAIDLDSDSEAPIVSTSGPRRIKMRRINDFSKLNVTRGVQGRYRAMKGKRADGDGRGGGKERRGAAGSSLASSKVPKDTRLVRVVFWTAHHTRPKIIHARLSKNFVQLAAVPALMDYLQLPPNAQWDRWDEYQCTWATNCTVDDKFWVPWRTSTILGRLHAPDPEAHGRVGGVCGLPAFGRELTLLEGKSGGIAREATPVVVHVLEERG